MPEYVVHAAMLLLAMLGGVRGFAIMTGNLLIGADCEYSSQCESGTCAHNLNMDWNTGVVPHFWTNTRKCM